MDRPIQQIMKARVRQGSEEILVVFEGDPPEAGRWVPAAPFQGVPLLQAFKSREEERRRPRPKAPPKRRLAAVLGLIPEAGGFSYVVRFEGAAECECVCNALMHRSYLGELLDFYEAHAAPAGREARATALASVQ
jgi:hypothetical protein